MFISNRKNEPSHYMLKIESFSLLSEAPTLKIESDVFEASGHKWSALFEQLHKLKQISLLGVGSNVNHFLVVNNEDNRENDTWRITRRHVRRLELYPNGKEEEEGSNHISLYVIICDTESLPKGWEVCVDVNFFIYDHTHHNYATFQDIMNGNRIRFHEKKMKWGFDKLISLDSFKKSGNGYVENDSCVFGAEVFAVTEYAQMDRCLSITKPPTIINTYTWKIDNFSDVTERVLQSEFFKVGKVKWELSIYPKGNDGVGTHISFYLGIRDTYILPKGWRVYAKYKLRLKNQGYNDDKEIETDAWFSKSALDWGYPRFMLLSELNDDSTNGFLLNGSLIVEAEFSLVGMFKNFI
ncbi:hypothetical protein OSB04_016168 [Centaurea solstitialis]|uniref:MATH domain-containing protein n=1 Tax=Centaurea solstitialis TaxID=347529 RepID=A0AA38T860_9ASTR|nr:hypothetical protein OSB04_016168 [Centaurea solstitialis]